MTKLPVDSKLKRWIEQGVCEQYSNGKVVDVRDESLAGISLAELKKKIKTVDTLIALDTLVERPDWKVCLKSWSNMGGGASTIITSAYSGDHLQHSKMMSPKSQASWPKLEEFTEYAASLGYGVRQVVPYGALLSDDVDNFWLKNIIANKGRYAWLRMLSWFEDDEVFFSFATFLQQTLFVNLGTAAMERFLIVLTKDALGEGRERQVMQPDTTSQPRVTREGLSHWVKEPLDDWLVSLDMHLKYLRNQVLFFLLLNALEEHVGPIPLEEVLAKDIVSEFSRWRGQENRDKRVMSVIQAWHKEPDMAALMQYNEVALGPGMEYELMQDVLTAYSGIFLESEIAK